MTDLHGRLAIARSQTKREFRSVRGSALTQAMSWEEKGLQLAAAYPDEDRRNWMRRQFGLGPEEG